MKRDIEAKLCEAALRLAAKKGWRDLSLEQIAAVAKISTAQTKKIFTDKSRVLPAIVRMIERRTLAKAGKADRRAAIHDRLFEIMMARFDVLQEHRAGILAILEEVRRDPSLARLIVPAQGESMKKILTHTEVSLDGVRGPVAAFGLLGVYYRALWVWRKDDTTDMAKTMAVLDQGLRCVGRAAEILFRSL